jgi:hypothetical protein
LIVGPLAGRPHDPPDGYGAAQHFSAVAGTRVRADTLVADTAAALVRALA